MSRKLNVAIVGGGIGGLSAANMLVRQGINVKVYERAPALGEVGAGVYVTPNALRHLYRIGLESALKAAGGVVSGGSEYYRKDGSFVAPMQTTASDGLEALGMHRADLLEILASALPEGVVLTGHDCVDLVQDAEGATLTFENGAKAKADVVIAADGIQSRLRALSGGLDNPVHSGRIAFRGLIDKADIPDWPMDAFQIWMGEGGQHFMTYPVRNNEIMNYVAFIPSTEKTRETWSSPGDPDALRAAFVGWDSRVTGLLDKIRTCWWWGLYDREPFERWTDRRLTLLGDAAHPMLPHLGQGANQAIEDGVALAAVLAGASAETAPDALLAYETVRRERAGQVQSNARQNGRRYSGEYEDIAQRDLEIAAAAEFRKWLYDYDVLAELKR